MSNIIEELNEIYEITIKDGKAIPNDVPDSVIAENMEELCDWYEMSLKCDMLNPLNCDTEKKLFEQLRVELMQYKEYAEFMGITKI